MYALHCLHACYTRSYASKNARDFYREHVKVPLTQIVDELVYNKRTRITDQKALDDTKTSLIKMLARFNKDYGQHISKSERLRLAKQQDMSLVEKKFGDYVEHALYNAVTGDIARVLLIQVGSSEVIVMPRPNRLKDERRHSYFILIAMRTIE